MRKRIDLSNKEFGSLRVINYSHTSQKRKEPYWNCKCSCGNTIQVKSSNLRNKKTKSCGCQSFRKISDKDYIGQQFGSIKIKKILEYKHRSCIYEYECIKCGYIGKKNKSKLKVSGCKSCSGGIEQIYEQITGKCWSSIKSGAKQRKLKFNITQQYIWNLFLSQDKKCSISGIELHFGDKNQFRTASLDRIDNSKGYIEGNVQWVHTDINLMKNNQSEEEFLKIIERIYKWQNQLIKQ